MGATVSARLGLSFGVVGALMLAGLAWAVSTRAGSAAPAALADMTLERR